MSEDAYKHSRLCVCHSVLLLLLKKVRVNLKFISYNLVKLFYFGGGRTDNRVVGRQLRFTFNHYGELVHKSIALGRITQNSGHYAAQGPEIVPRTVPRLSKCT